MTTIKTAPKIDKDWGVCPQCHGNDGMLYLGKSHWHYCKQHKVMWTTGSNIFSGWRLQTEDEQRRIYEEIGCKDFEIITPWSPPEHPHAERLREQARILFDIADELDGTGPKPSEPAEPCPF
jgi:hypothetical protein